MAMNFENMCVGLRFKPKDSLEIARKSDTNLS